MIRLRPRRPRERRRRGVYVIPTLFTVGNIFCGFLSVVESSRGNMELAAILIMVAGVADILDGRIARLTGATTAFGEVYDSLADVVSFGLAPAILAFSWGLRDVPRLGMAASFLFLVAGSIRLARFSSRAHEHDTFTGLPIPAGAGAVALLVLLSPTPLSRPYFIPVVAVFLLGLSVLMVSTLPYRSFKDLNLRRQWPATTVFLIAIVFSLVSLTPHVLSLLLAVYILSAPLTLLTKSGRARLRKPPVESPPSPAEEHHEPPDPG